MIFDSLMNIAVVGVRPPQEAERPGSEGQRRQPSGGKSPKREHEEEARSPHPVLNIQGETTGKVIDTEA